MASIWVSVKHLLPFVVFLKNFFDVVVRPDSTGSRIEEYKV
jgi:hypothetical protein